MESHYVNFATINSTRMRVRFTGGLPMRMAGVVKARPRSPRPLARSLRVVLPPAPHLRD